MADESRRGPGWLDPERQFRALKTQASMLDAAQTLIMQNGVAATTMADIAQKAGSSVSTVYRYFEDKQSMVNAVVDRLVEDTVATVVELVDPARWSGATLGQIIDRYVRFSLRTGEEQRRIRAAGRELTDMNRLARERFDAVERQGEIGLSSLMLARREEIGHPDPETAVAYVLEQMAAMIDRRLDPESALGNRQPKIGNYDDERFILETVRSACGYLQTPMPDEE